MNIFAIPIQSRIVKEQYMTDGLDPLIVRIKAESDLCKSEQKIYLDKVKKIEIRSLEATLLLLHQLR